MCRLICAPLLFTCKRKSVVFFMTPDAQSDISTPLLFTCNTGDKFHSFARNYERNLERTSNSFQSTHLTGRVLWKESPKEVILHITPLNVLYCIYMLFKGQVLVFAVRVKIVSHSSCWTSAIFKYFCHLQQIRFSGPYLLCCSGIRNLSQRSTSLKLP